MGMRSNFLRLLECFISIMVPLGLMAGRFLFIDKTNEYYS